jgi:quinol monooxygenase YgiN
MIHVVAIITAHPGQREGLLQATHQNLAAVRAEAGCIEYIPVIDAPDIGSFQAPIGPDSFVMIEKWESKEALMAHATAPHMTAYSQKTRELVASRAIHILTPA